MKQNGSSESPPVFILGSARSGSTLLRYIVDTHPDICCPGELELGELCRHLFEIHHQTTGQVCSGMEGDEIRERVYEEVRRTAGGIMSSYAAAKGKTRWCEKSAGNLIHIDLLNKLFPGAKHLCLHRHCMDVVWSLFEISRHGFMDGVARYVQQNPRDVIGALAEYWCDYTERLLEFEQAYSGHCFRVKYESLVFDPSSSLREMFSFLEATWDESIVDNVFRRKHDSGRGDIKVQFSKDIHKNSVGKGAVLDWNRFGNVRGRVNKLLRELDYAPVGPEPNGEPAVIGVEAPDSSNPTSRIEMI